MRLLPLAAAVAMAVSLASCSSETPDPINPPASSDTPTTGHGALAECLSEYGVPAAAGPVAVPPPGVDQDTWQKAMQACSPLGPGPAN
jgi:uncharacterized lipoprotein YbaY